MRLPLPVYAMLVLPASCESNASTPLHGSESTTADVSTDTTGTSVSSCVSDP